MCQDVPGSHSASGGVGHRGGPDKLSSLRNNHMTILHSSLHMYIHAVHDLHCIPRYNVRHWNPPTDPSTGPTSKASVVC